MRVRSKIKSRSLADIKYYFSSSAGLQNGPTLNTIVRTRTRIQLSSEYTTKATPPQSSRK